MRFSFSAEQEEFRTTLRRALEARSPTKEVRRLMATEAGFERESWQKLNQELGLTGIHIPEAYGGQGFGFGELGIVLEEMGRNLLCAPYFSTAALAATAILNLSLIHISEPTRLLSISYAVFCLKKKI